MKNNARKTQTPGKVRYRTPSRFMARSDFAKSRQVTSKMKTTGAGKAGI